ncbi:MAG: dephospho-CoA kinase [Candidatus Margulisiibacteriota bacterium]
MIIGLTGPMGAGKSEVAKILKRQGYFIIDADQVAHQLYTPQSPIWSELVKAFGARILNRGGNINRRKLGEIVFADKDKLEQLNRIVHPGLREEIRKLTIENRKLKIGINAALPVLFEGLADKVWVVTASKEKRLRRLVKNGSTKAQALKRMRSQLNQSAYLKLADVVIKNEGTLKQLVQQVRNADKAVIS